MRLDAAIGVGYCRSMQTPYVNKLNKLHKSPTSHGFTIVELLIAIVVIAILAAISIAAYTSISNRAYDSVVQSDLSQMSKAVKLFNAKHGRYPTQHEIFSTTLGLKVSKSAYHPNSYNLYYCTNSSDRSKFGIASRSKSGQTFTISSTGGIAKSVSGPSWAVACGAFGESELENVNFTYAYSRATGQWLHGLSD